MSRSSNLSLGFGLTPWIVVAGALVALGCAQTDPGGRIHLETAVDFDFGDGTRAFRIEPTGGGEVSVRDRQKVELVKIRLASGSFEIRGEGGRPSGVVVVQVDEKEGIERPRFILLRPGDGGTLCEVRVEPDGDLELVDPSGKRIMQAKRRDYGYKMVDHDGALTAKVRRRPVGVSVRDASGETFLSTRDPFPLRAVAVLLFEALAFDQATGLAVAVAHWSETAGEMQ